MAAAIVIVSVGFIVHKESPARIREKGGKILSRNRVNPNGRPEFGNAVVAEKDAVLDL